MRRKEELKSGRRNRPEEGTLLPGTTCSLRKGHIASFLRAWMDVRPMMEVVKGAAFGILQVATLNKEENGSSSKASFQSHFSKHHGCFLAQSVHVNQEVVGHKLQRKKT
ncbi:PREDICTED: uncharacterized protein LOC104805428 isoform X1 [Tarenaya hassleriana]|uniref:uncharacterized protein LOC104805428 isoform X1 n=1 Tax=Tarenaya hassleriana TaxID=28532 RepID=UPI0008FD7782|nr:PREDICTED: uncharacterized protein LOC104805428 isoform X1 [Tarenaya hassleriana]XP_019057142.1 PREDICTED: uncharacterized protein LOC104805428 isoform X1 [Tarenaya hassleriana]